MQRCTASLDIFSTSPFDSATAISASLCQLIAQQASRRRRGFQHVHDSHGHVLHAKIDYTSYRMYAHEIVKDGQHDDVTQTTRQCLCCILTPLNVEKSQWNQIETRRILSIIFLYIASRIARCYLDG